MLTAWICKISIRRNSIEYWVHLRCAGIRKAQYTDITQTHYSHRHNTTPPIHTLVQAPYKLPTYATHTTTTKTQTHVQHFPCSHRIGKSQTKYSHPLTPSPPTLTRAIHLHISHTPPTPHIQRTTLLHNMSAVIDTIPEPRVPPTCHSPTTPHPPPHASISVNHTQSHSLSRHTCNTDNSTRITVTATTAFT